MRFVGRGHPAIRATHPKTLELSPDAGLTERGTCIVAVSADAQPLEPMAGRVRLRITAGDQRASLDASANSSWDPGGPVVIRRSALRLPGTFATDASAGAADLPRALVAALQDPDALVTVDVTRIADERPTVVLFAADPTRPADPRLAAELAAADSVHAQDTAARRLVQAHSGTGGTGGSGSTGGGPRGRRHLVVATLDLPAEAGAGAGPGEAIETVGLTPPLAAAAACAGPGPVVLAPSGADPRELLRHTPAGHRLVLGTTTDTLADLLALARELRGSTAGALAREWAHPVRIADGDTPELGGRDVVYLGLDAIAAGSNTLDPDVRAAIVGLLREGVPTKVAARALAELTGRSRRAAYDEVLALTGGTSQRGES